MDTNIKGLVRTLELRHSQGMMPLYEAVSNAMDSIADRTGTLTDGRVDIYLLRKEDLAASGSDELQPIDGIRVVDDGVGFDDRHLSSFREAYTEHKLKSGGKGLGRFTYLKVFDSVEITSTFRDTSGKLKARRFRFSVEREVFDHSISEPGADTREGTELVLRGMQRDYAPSWPRNGDAVAQRLVMHFLIRFASVATPEMILHDRGIAPIRLRALFDATVQPHIEETNFEIGGHSLDLQILRQGSGRDSHELNYCAVGRKVTDVALRKLMPDLPQVFHGEDGSAFSLLVLVTGEYLDKHANSARTEFVFNPDDEDLSSDADLISHKQLNEAVVTTLRSILGPEIETSNRTKIEVISTFVENEAPEYRVLLRDEYRPMLEREVPAGASGTKLDHAALLRIRRKVEDQVRDSRPRNCNSRRPPILRPIQGEDGGVHHARQRRGQGSTRQLRRSPQDHLGLAGP